MTRPDPRAMGLKTDGRERMLRTDYCRPGRHRVIPLPGPLRLTPRWPFAGRSAELVALRSLWAETAADGRRVALVAGEAGIGKTRLIREFAHEAAAPSAAGQ